ncbi:MAG TPA: hypothetical protein VH325_05305 [Bryobacteraceae bacterium]|jgi:hypothetical protein|nr:hypothetical protein [Bryobacteraceae bacterium]
MDSALATTIVSSAGSVIVGVFGMFFTANQLGRRIDETNHNLNRRMDELNANVREFRTGFNVFRDAVNGKLATMDSEIAKLMDRIM